MNSRHEAQKVLDEIADLQFTHLDRALHKHGYQLQSEELVDAGDHDSIYSMVYAPDSELGSYGITVLRTWNYAAADDVQKFISTVGEGPLVQLLAITKNVWTRT